MRVAVVVFPGINAEQEMIQTLGVVCDVRAQVVQHTDLALPEGTDLAVLPGGFSYGDYLRAGAIARTSPIVEVLRRHADRGGYVLGVCNGFQILAEAGLVPGALLKNAHGRFDCRDVHVVVTSEGPFTRKVGAVMRLPIANGEGRYFANEPTLRALEEEGRIALRYSDRAGSVNPSENPNGSAQSIAGVYGGERKNVLGLMPHPERMSEPLHGGVDGALLFRDALASLATR